MPTTLTEELLQFRQNYTDRTNVGNSTKVYISLIIEGEKYKNVDARRLQYLNSIMRTQIEIAPRGRTKS